MARKKKSQTADVSSDADGCWSAFIGGSQGCCLAEFFGCSSVLLVVPTLVVVIIELLR